MLQAFLDSNEPQSMVISPNIAGHLHIHTDWPSALRNKGVYFVKKEKTPIPEDEVTISSRHVQTNPPQNFDLCEFLAFGDIYPNALDHFCGWVEEVDQIYNERFKIQNFCKGDCAHIPQRKQHDEVSAMCLIRHQEAGELCYSVAIL